MSDSKTTLNGSCKCGSVKYSVDVKLEPDGSLSASRCNCTFCTKLATTYCYLDGPQDFKLLEPESFEKMGTFAPRAKTCPRYFCQHCGSQICLIGYYEIGGARRDITAVNVSTVDQPQGDVNLKKTHLKYYGMLNGNMETKSEPYDNGLI